MKKSTIYSIISIIIVMILLAWYFGIGFGSGRHAASAPMKYKEFPVKSGTFQIIVTASGIVQPIDRIEIKSKASGRVEELPIEEGDYIEKGALIARLDQTDVQAELEQARADLEIAEVELRTARNSFDRKEKLFELSLISPEERDEAELMLAQAKGKIVRARTRLPQAEVNFSETIVRAPIGGLILQKYVEKGQIITSGISNVGGGTPIVDIADMRSVYIKAGIDEIDVGKIGVGQMANVKTEAYPQKHFRGAIIRVLPEARVEQNVTLFDVVIEVENESGKLKSGMNATVEITITREENVLLVATMVLQPSKKPSAEKNVRRVLILEGEEFVPRQIRVGRSNFRQTIVTSGLKEGDILGVPMTSRLKADNDRLEQRIKSSRSFGSSGSSNSGGKK